MHRTIATVSMSGTLRQKLEAIAAAGFDGIELFENDFINFNGSAAELRAMCADLGLSIDLYQPLRDIEGLPDALFRRALERAERKFDVMQELGAPMVLVCSNTSAQALAGVELAAEQLRELAERASRRQLRIGYEALAWGRHVKLYGQAWAIVERASHPNLGLILDSFHTLSLNDDPAGIARIPGDKIFFLQMADAPRLGMDVLQWARHFRCFPGQGQFDVDNFLEQVLLSGYSGPLSLEIFNDVLRAAPVRRTATDAMRSLLFLESQVRARLERSPPSADDGLQRRQALDRIELFNPPAVPLLSGMALLEFAVDAGTATALSMLLEQMGFHRAGTHRSRPGVTLYRQGNINLLLNAQADTFASARFATHGPSVCAIGLVSADPLRAVERATALQSAPFDGAFEANAQPVPAIRAPGGMALHFLPANAGAEAFCGADFVPDDAPLVPDAGLKAIDHVALGLASDELDTWVLFCRSVLGLDASDSLELADPFGLIRSCGLANPARNVRFVLNISSSQKTRTAQVIAAGGSSVHHIALSCTDIFATVARMRANGVAFVPISPNYYADLLARYAIDSELIERMRGLGVLFDRSADGDYFHIYTDSFAERFFFEFVQRADGYDAYGALNAPARMASQAQQAEEG